MHELLDRNKSYRVAGSSHDWYCPMFAYLTCTTAKISTRLSTRLL